MADHIFIDPYRRDTAAAIGLSAVYLSQIDPNAVFGVFPSDHYIGKPEVFKSIVLAAGRLAQEGHVVTIGIRPSGPETGYGYIEMDDLFSTSDGQDAFQVRRFVEKPDRATAEKYVEAGNYLWNSGMFAWSVPTILGLSKNISRKHMND